MTAIADRSEFLRLLELSKLLDADTLAPLKADADLPDDPGELAERLIQDGKLTRFQARQLLAGKHRGFILGPYRLLDQIGQGGMGTVFLAEHVGMKRKLALKVLSREHAENPTAVDRFHREARAATALAHPNIVRVHHVGNAGGVHYLVMEYVDGVTLESLIDRKGPFTIEEAVKIAAQTAAGLQQAHEKGFVHRDIKPENLMLARNGAVKILDMGLTKSINREEDNLTGAMKLDTILGTIDYLSPEQAIQSDVDTRADIYSLGATFFTLLCGYAPYEGVPAKQKLMQHQFGTVPDVRKFRPDVPDELAAVVLKMMAKKPDDRFQTAVEIIDALTPWLGDGVNPAAGVVMPSSIMRSPSRPSSLTPTVNEAESRTKGEMPAHADDLGGPSSVIAGLPAIEAPTPSPDLSGLSGFHLPDTDEQPSSVYSVKNVPAAPPPMTHPVVVRAARAAAADKVRRRKAFILGLGLAFAVAAAGVAAVVVLK